MPLMKFVHSLQSLASVIEALFNTRPSQAKSTTTTEMPLEEVSVVDSDLDNPVIPTLPKAIYIKPTIDPKRCGYLDLAELATLAESPEHEKSDGKTLHALFFTREPSEPLHSFNLSSEGQYLSPSPSPRVSTAKNLELSEPYFLSANCLWVDSKPLAIILSPKGHNRRHSEPPVLNEQLSSLEPLSQTLSTPTKNKA